MKPKHYKLDEHSNLTKVYFWWSLNLTFILNDLFFCPFVLKLKFKPQLCWQYILCL